MEQAVAVFVIVNFSIIGLSHIFQRQSWAELFLLLESKGKAGAFINGFLGLSMGSIIVAFHSVWTGAPLILTLIGWAYLVKSSLIFLVPSWGVRSMARIQTAGPTKFVVAGVGMLGIAATLGVTILRGYPGS